MRRHLSEGLLEAVLAAYPRKHLPHYCNRLWPTLPCNIPRLSEFGEHSHRKRQPAVRRGVTGVGKGEGCIKALCYVTHHTSHVYLSRSVEVLSLGPGNVTLFGNRASVGVIQ